jgi:hypothetical protein
MSENQVECFDCHKSTTDYRICLSCGEYICTKCFETHNCSKEPLVVPRKVEFPDYEVPENLASWDVEHQTTPEYNKMVSDILTCADFISKTLNEGPEVKDSVTKRMITLRAVLRVICLKTLATHFLRLGVVEQIKFDILYEQQMQIQMEQYQKMMLAKQGKCAQNPEQNGKKGNSYVA